MNTRLTDVDGIFAGRAIPAVRIGIGTNGIRRVVRVCRRTIPVMLAIFVRRETDVIRCTVTVTAVGALRQRRRVLLGTSRAIPIIVAERLSAVFSINPYAGFTEPVAVTDHIGRMPHAVLGAVRAPPLMRTVLRRRIDTVAVTAPTIFIGTDRRRLQMAVLMSRMIFIDVTVPRVIARRLFRGIIRFSTSFFRTIPVAFGAYFGKRMASVALRAIPAVLAVRRIGGIVMR